MNRPAAASQPVTNPCWSLSSAALCSPVSATRRSTCTAAPTMPPAAIVPQGSANCSSIHSRTTGLPEYACIEEGVRLPKICKLAHALLWEYSYKRLNLAQLLGQLGHRGTWMELSHLHAAARRAALLGGRGAPSCEGGVVEAEGGGLLAAARGSLQVRDLPHGAQDRRWVV